MRPQEGVVIVLLLLVAFGPIKAASMAREQERASAARIPNRFHRTCVRITATR